MTMWLHDAWYHAAWSDDVQAGEIFPISVIDKPLVLFRGADGTAACLEDRCCHRFAPLSKGRMESGQLRCMYHGMKFAPDGQCVEIPGQDTIPNTARVSRFAVCETGGRIWVWMGDAATADTDLVPYAEPIESKSWEQRTGHLDFAADYQLLNDNLLDLSHLTFVHQNTLGRGSPQWALNRPRMTVLPRGLRFQRWNRDDRGAGLRQFGDLFDVWNQYDFLAPGIFLQRTSWFTPGTADACQGGEPDLDKAVFERLDEQSVTPMTARNTRYFYAVGVPYNTVSAEWTEKILRFTAKAFAEDRDIIEAQQAIVDREPDAEMVTTTLDAGPIRFRRLLQGLIHDSRAA